MSLRGVCALTAFAAVLLIAAASARAECPPDGARFEAFYADRAPFDAAIAKARDISLPDVPLSGITVPHHLAADHLVAGGLRLTAGHRYHRIIVLFPDHFRALKMPFGILRNGFETVLGRVEVDADSVGALGQADALSVEIACALADDHGLRALLPFIRYYHRDTPIVPVAVATRSEPADWDRLVAALTPIAGPDTLVVQSTDFSHYLPHHEARQRDQQTLNILASGSLDALADLVLPDHLDSPGAMYVQMALQAKVHEASPQVLAGENLQQYSSSFVAETTSYLVIGFSPNDAETLSPLGKESHRYFFAGDTFFGRAMTAALADADAADRVAAAVLKHTGGAPMVVNLEGVLLPDVPAGIDHMILAMPRDLALQWLERLNVVGVGLANNHATDIGETGFAETTDALDNAGLKWFGQGDRLNLPGLAVVGLTDIDTNNSPQTDLLDDALLDRLIVADAETPVVTFVHWGREYATEAGPRELELAAKMQSRGVAAIIGAHPHRASVGIKALGGGDTALVYSLGNFLFDQGGDTGTGALAQVTVFDQGTIFVRQLPIANLFDMARSQ